MGAFYFKESTSLHTFIRSGTMYGRYISKQLYSYWSWGLGAFVMIGQFQKAAPSLCVYRSKGLLLHIKQCVAAIKSNLFICITTSLNKYINKNCSESEREGEGDGKNFTVWSRRRGVCMCAFYFIYFLVRVKGGWQVGLGW